MSAAQVTSKTTKDTELRAVIGTNADYYLTRWKGTKRVGFNLAAFGVAGLWLPYRKMHRATAALFGLILLESMSSDLARASGVMRPETPKRLEVAATIAICWICGAFGNRWYRSHVDRVIGVVRRMEPDEAQRLTVLAARGGTSIRSAVLWTFAGILILGVASHITRRVLGLPDGTD
jgi:hypothetical protein